MDDLYQDELLDHYQHPHHFGRLDHPTHRTHELNASCGDVIDLDLIIDKDQVKDIKFICSGCAISTAAASMLSDEIIGKNLTELKQIDFDYMQKLIGVKITPGRIKCLTLAAKALIKAIS